MSESTKPERRTWSTEDDLEMSVVRVTDRSGDTWWHVGKDEWVELEDRPHNNAGAEPFQWVLRSWGPLTDATEPDDVPFGSPVAVQVRLMRDRAATLLAEADAIEKAAAQ